MKKSSKNNQPQRNPGVPLDIDFISEINRFLNKKFKKTKQV